MRTTFLALLAVTLLAGCGGGGGDGPEPPERREEMVQPVPDLPDGWKVEINRAGGFAFGVPPGWSAERRGTLTLVASPDRRVAISISADRTDEALEGSLARFAADLARGLDGFERVEAGEPRPFEAFYEASQLSASAEGGEKPDQRLRVVVLRRPGVVTFSVLVARRASEKEQLYRTDVDRLIRSLRGRPVTV